MFAPYRDAALDRIYNGLFCDQPHTLLPQDGQPAAGWQRLLMAEPADLRVLRALAEDGDGEARVRALAYRRLQQQGQGVPARQLLGVVIEVPLDSGLDTLAAYLDGSVRFVHGSGKSTFVEGPMATLQPIVQRLLVASQAVVDRIGPSDQPRLAPPQRNVRMSFIVSDGLYFGEGPMQALMADGLAGPVLHAAIELLDQVTGLVAA